MTPYLILYFYLFSSILIVNYIQLLNIITKSDYRIISFIIIVPFIFFNLYYSSSIGTDLFSYNRIYDEFKTNTVLIEPIFYLFFLFLNYIDANYNIFRLILCILEFYLLNKIISKINGKLTFIFFYFSIFYINNHFNALKQGLATLFLGVFLLYNKNRIIGLVTILTHYTTIIYVYLFSKIKVNIFIKFFFLSSIISLIIYYYRTYLNDISIYKYFYGALYIKIILIFLTSTNKIVRLLSIIILFLTQFINPILSRLLDPLIFISILQYSNIQSFKITIKKILIIFFTLLLFLSNMKFILEDCINSNKNNWCIKEGI